MPTSISTKDSTKKSSFFQTQTFKITKSKIIKNNLIFLISSIEQINFKKLCLWVRKKFRDNKVFPFINNYLPKIFKFKLIKFIFNNDMSELLVDSSISDDTKCVAPSDQLTSKEGNESDRNSPPGLNIRSDKNSDDVKTDNNVESTSDDAIIGPKKTTKTVSFSNKISFHYF